MRKPTGRPKAADEMLFRLNQPTRDASGWDASTGPSGRAGWPEACIASGLTSGAQVIGLSSEVMPKYWTPMCGQ